MKDKIIIVTGASAGLGKIVSKKLADENAKVILVGHNEIRLKEAVTEIGHEARAYVCDISSHDQVVSTAKAILNDYGKVDILINNAGVWTDEELEKTTPELRKRVFEVNALGTIEFIKAFEPTFRQQNYGHILNVISVSGVDDSSAADNTLWQTYGASKWALTGFTRAFKDSLAGTGIKVTGIYPGGFESNLYETAGIDDAHEQPWMMRTADVADALLFCLTRPSDMLIEKMVITKFDSSSS